MSFCFVSLPFFCAFIISMHFSYREKRTAAIPFENLLYRFSCISYLSGKTVEFRTVICSEALQYSVLRLQNYSIDYSLITLHRMPIFILYFPLCIVFCVFHLESYFSLQNSCLMHSYNEHNARHTAPINSFNIYIEYIQTISPHLLCMHRK